MHVSLAFVRNGNRCGSDRLRCGPTAQAHLPALQNVHQPPTTEIEIRIMPWGSAC